jgi:ATP-dependent RNA helicase RhlE
MHRIGRTGRADKKGQAITFITPQDAEAIEAIEELMNRRIAIVDLPEESYNCHSFDS